MKTWKYVIPVAIVLLLAGPLAAQTDNDIAATKAAKREAEVAVSEVAERHAEVARRMQEVESRMAEAAHEMAELTSERLPRIAHIERRVEFLGRPRLGVTIGNDYEKGPVEGVSIVAVSPGSAAGDAGLRAGDVITSINEESFSGPAADEANKKLLDFMAGVEEGDALDVEYLRNGKVGKVEVLPRAGGPNIFVWEDGDHDQHLRALPRAPLVPYVEGLSNFSWVFAGNGLGDMELVELSAGLGRYFGTDTGLLVVSAPESNDLQLQDGDVIQSIGGREPKSVRHGLQILGSYQAGEKLELQIMRDKKRKTLNIEMPDDRSSLLRETFEAPARPTSMLAPTRAPARVTVIDRT